MKERDKGRIKVKCRYATDITCSYFTALHLKVHAERRLGVLTQCVSHTFGSAKGSGNFYFGLFEKSGFSMN